MNWLIKANIAAMMLLISLVIASCAGAFDQGYKYVDEPLQEYVRDYHNLVKYHCPKLYISPHYSITFAKKLEKKTWVGVCTKYMSRYNIKILQSFWETSNPVERRQLMYHELSHCILDRDHEEKLPGHYMYPSIEYVPYEVYIQQTIDDIESYCKRLKWKT